jgi:hypothetical protein
LFFLFPVLVKKNLTNLSAAEDEAAKRLKLEKKTIDKEEALQSILRKIFDVLYFKKGLSCEMDLTLFDMYG